MSSTQAMMTVVNRFTCVDLFAGRTTLGQRALDGVPWRLCDSAISPSHLTISRVRHQLLWGGAGLSCLRAQALRNGVPAACSGLAPATMPYMCRVGQVVFRAASVDVITARVGVSDTPCQAVRSMARSLIPGSGATSQAADCDDAQANGR